jgi:hypothetical protein
MSLSLEKKIEKGFLSKLYISETDFVTFVTGIGVIRKIIYSNLSEYRCVFYHKNI